MSGRVHRVLATLLLTLIAFLAGGCDLGGVLDSMAWTRIAPRNADLLGTYRAGVYLGTNVATPLDGRRVDLTLSRDGSLSISADGDVPQLRSVRQTNLDAFILPAAAGRWRTSQDEDGYWLLQLDLVEPVVESHEFHLVNDKPPYSFYSYFDGYDSGHSVGWIRISAAGSDLSAGTPDAPEPVPAPRTAQMQEVEDAEFGGTMLLGGGFLVIVLLIVVAIVAVIIAFLLALLAAIALLCIGVAIVAAVCVAAGVGFAGATACIASIVAAARGSLGAGARTLGALWGGTVGMVAGAGASWLADVALRRPIDGWTAAAIGAVVGAAAGAFAGFWIAALAVRALDLIATSLRAAIHRRRSPVQG